MNFKDIQNEKLIVSKSQNNLIIVYLNPKNWRKNDEGQRVFDCDKFISIFPRKNTIIVEDEPNPKTGKITDTIRHEDDFYTKKEGLPIVFNRIFK